MPVVEEPPGLDDGHEQRSVYEHRYREALAAGLTLAEAELWASSEADVGELRRLARSGCPPALLARIVL